MVRDRFVWLHWLHWPCTVDCGLQFGLINVKFPASSYQVAFCRIGFEGVYDTQVTGFAELRLIAGEHNCSYSSFLSGKSLIVDFILRSKIKSTTLLLYI